MFKDDKPNIFVQNALNMKNAITSSFWNPIKNFFYKIWIGMAIIITIIAIIAIAITFAYCNYWKRKLFPSTTNQSKFDSSWSKSEHKAVDI